MNRYAIRQNSFAAYEEMRGNAAACRSVEMKETVICPKPRRLGLLQTSLHEPSYPRPLRWHASHHQELFDSKAGSELLDIILAKGGGCGSDQAVPPVASSPPFFSGSPPSRVSNPLIQDARFMAEHSTPASPRAVPAPSPSSTRKGGCVRANFGNNPAVRVEGFDCLDRDRRNCTIPALA
ncbi:hypothetical protein SASPL_140403 [Salvia splendens]|uniref:Uncharacterized protein n=1 Tax=Salvia splendens TaxID=180675 RepID=A0A8X8WQE0_SALSN|nr:uncharacterized protein LOC121768976 isoform X2 [Salvia splendens]KAG6398931.1 hypothetical protein SASPL_140403 [Salvia splendens]